MEGLLWKAVGSCKTRGCHSSSCPKALLKQGPVQWVWDVGTSLGRLFQAFPSHLPWIPAPWFVPSTPTAGATWRTRPLPTPHSQNPEQMQFALPLLSHAAATARNPGAVPPVNWCFSYTWKPKMDMIPQSSPHSCWIKRNNYFGSCLTESFAQSIHLRPVLLYQNIPRFFFALRCKLIYDKKLNIK